MNGSEIGRVRVEQRQRRVSVGPAGRVSGMVPANAGADAIAEVPELGLSPDESAQIVGMGEDGVGVGVRDPDGLVEQALLVGRPQGIVGMVLAVIVEDNSIAVVANPPYRGLDVRYSM